MSTLELSTGARKGRWVLPVAAVLLVSVMLLPAKYGVALSLAIVGSVLVLSRPWWGVAFLAVLLPANNLISQKLGNGATSTAFGAIKDGVLLLLLLAAVNRRVVRRDIAWPAVAVAVLGFVGFAYSNSGLTTALYGWRNDYEPILLIIAIASLLTEAQTVRLKTIIVGAAEIAAAIGIYTHSLGLSWLIRLGIFPGQPGAFPYQYFSANNYQPRAFSPLAAPNEFGAYLDIGLAVILTRTDWPLRRRLLLCVLPVLGIYEARSRSALLGVGLLVAVLTVRTIWTRVGAIAGWALALAGTIVIIAVLVQFLSSHTGLSATGTDPSLVGHAASLQTGIRNALTHPLGYGLGNVGPRALKSSQSAVLVESFWLLIALESGLLVLAAFVFALWRYVSACVRAGGPAFVGVACFAATIVTQLVLPTMQDGPVSFMFWMVMGIALVGVRVRDSETDVANRGFAAPSLVRRPLHVLSSRI